MTITPNQLKRLHMLKRDIGLDDEMRRGIISDRFGVSSFKALTYSQASELIKEWGEEVKKLWIKQKQFDGGCSKKQIDMITALSYRLGAHDHLDVLQKTEKFLQGRGKIKRRIASLSNLTPKEANKIIEAMKSRLERSNDRPSPYLKGPGFDKRDGQSAG